MLGKSRTKAEQKRIEEIHERGCVPCWLESKLKERRWIPEPCDIHHVAQDDWAQTYGNCPWHHRGIVKPLLTEADMLSNFGPSMAKEPGRYRARYGTEEELLGFQVKLLVISPNEYMRQI